ncbi:MAG TPA: ATP-binding cassette domain-containing protein, partial [Thermomicrobiales bacterium]|nr:ATP-binding cassette domain-containing protein [Thermomicrobiales bacterium]
MIEPLLQVRDLRKEYEIPRGALEDAFGRLRARLTRRGSADGAPPVAAPAISRIVNALDGVSLEVKAGEVVGIVGESGCGKSTLAACILKLVEPTSGAIRFAGQDVNHLEGEGLKGFRRDAQVVFQDPTASLDPRWSVATSLAEPLEVHGLAAGQALRRRQLELIEDVGLRPDHLSRLPHELSGGEKQRVCIARALATSPRLLILDEPTSALDASTRIHILKLLVDLKREHNMTYVLISHDLSVIRAVCDRVLVMYLGRIVEAGATDVLFDLPLHPYTEALLSAIPVPDPDLKKERVRLRGETGSV